jgi:hypothetical protein
VKATQRKSKKKRTIKRKKRRELYDGDIFDPVMPMCLAAVKIKIVAKATPTVPFSIRRARGRSGELAYGCPQEHFHGLYSRVSSAKDFIDAMIPRCSKEFSCWHDVGQKQGSRIFFVNRALVISKSATRRECIEESFGFDFTSHAKLDELELGWRQLHFLVRGRTPRNPMAAGAAKWS